MVALTLEAFAETTMSSKPRDSKCAQNATALAASLSASGQSRSRYSSASEPAFTPMRIGMPASPAASMTASTRSRVADVAGVDAQLGGAAPGGVDREVWSKWTSATTGSGERATIVGEAVERVRVAGSRRARSRTRPRPGARSARAWPRRRACRCSSSTAPRWARRRRSALPPTGPGASRAGLSRCVLALARSAI